MKHHRYSRVRQYLQMHLHNIHLQITVIQDQARESNICCPIIFMFLLLQYSQFTLLIIIHFMFLKILFIYLIERAQKGGVAGRGRRKSRLPAEQETQWGTQSQHPGIMT